MYYEDYEAPFTIKDGNLSAYGRCSKCKYFKVQFTKLHDEIAWCTAHSEVRGTRRPNKKDPIMSCSSYYERSHPELWEMERMATLIDVKVHRRAGFVSDTVSEVREVNVVQPKKKRGLTYEEPDE
jgi:hypothetical protein